MSGANDGLGGPLPDPSEELRYRATRELVPATTGAITALLERLDDPSWRVRGAAAGRLSEGDPAQVVPGMIAALEGQGSPGKRAAAAGALVSVGGPAVPALLELLARPTAETRAVALEILGDIHRALAVPEIARHLADADANVRFAAAAALGKCGGPEAVAALDAALEAGDIPMRRAVLDALVQLRAPLRAERLATIASVRSLRRSALRLAGWSGDPAALELLVDGLVDPSRATREAALAGLGQRGLADVMALGWAADAVRQAVRRAPEIPDRVAEVLEGRDVAVCMGALLVLKWVGGPRHASAVAAAAEDERLRALAAEVLDALGAEAAPVLRAQLSALTPAARIVASVSLARAGDRAAFEELTALLSEEDEELRESAIASLGRLGSANAVAALLPLLENASPEVSGAAVASLARLAEYPALRAKVLEVCRARAASPMPPAHYRLLGRIGEADDALTLRAGLKAAHRGTRVAAAGALAALGARTHVSPTVLPELLDALDDGEPIVRAAAAQALGSLGRAPIAWGVDWSEATRALAMALRDDEPSVRAAAALALGCCGADTFVGALSELARDPAASSEVVVAAIHALAQLGAADAGVLGAAAKHDDPEVVKEAVRAAATLPGQAMAELLLTAAVHSRWDVRCAAAIAIGQRGDRALLGDLHRLSATERDPLVAKAMDEARCRLEDRS